MAPTPPPGAAGIYVRISEDREGKAANVQIQEEDCRKVAAQERLPLRDVYCDNDISASRFGRKRRPNYERLLEDIEAGVIQHVIAYHPSRLHRRPRELERYIDITESHGVLTHTVRAGRWDLSTPSGRIQARIMASVDAYDSEQKSDLIKRKRQAQAKAGAFHGGLRPYGYEADGVTVREAEKAELVRCIEAVVTWTEPMSPQGGQSLRHLVRDLNRRGVPTSTGRQWTCNALKKAIMAPRVAGISTYKGEVVGTGEWPALVSEETWRAACKVLTDNARWTGDARGGTVKWLGSNLYICGVCGQPSLRVASGSHKRSTYRCRNRDNGEGGGHVTREARSLDRFVEQVLVDKLSDPRVLAKLAKTNGAKIDVRKLQVEQEAIGRLMEEQAEMHAMGEITRAQLAAGTRRLTEKAEAITEQLAQAGRRTPLEPLINHRGKTAAEVWYGPGGADGDRAGGLSLGARRAIIAVVATITVNKTARGKHRQPDGGFLDRDSIDFAWRAGGH
jgi:DNA invertase Pin-like site-specific DNA recombinase